ncbi:MAG: hypothetical protein SPI03_02500 [Campylobacter sputorum]|uniref:hypothetical protein n=1 Tax=Campylobacter sputorum TaxID=206 RepID=UPI000B789CD4|nr:hypothetical protein [Campylobacter sputorum]MDY6120201.1 hypothetical protein [Campylobacter sputorum]
MEKLINDENKFDLEIKQNFKVLGDANYLSITIKNILENTLKYNDFSKQSKILIKIYDNRRRKTIKATKFLHSKFLTRSKFKRMWQGLKFF